jgi:hypothetical protein
MTKAAVVTLCLLQSLILLVPREAAADAVTSWNATAARAALAACISPIQDPLHESRLYAMMHVAIHDALNAIDRRSRPYAFRGRAEAWTSADAAVAAAARHVLVPLLGQIGLPFPPVCGELGIAVVESDYQAALSRIPDGAAKAEGIELGRAAAAAILTLRDADGSDIPLLDFAYPQGTAPGEYRFTPGFAFAFAPGWGGVTRFVPDRVHELRVSPPLRLDSRRYLADFMEVKALGGDGVTTPSARTPDQTEIALFWVESSPLQWNRIARAASDSQGLDPWENARLFGLLNIALADGYVATFATKYRYNFWRPVTAIREAATDGNPDTIADPAWSPLVPTPPIPEHDSGHSVEGGAAAQVLKRFFNTDRIEVSTCSLTLPPGLTCADASPLYRSYTSFTQAAEENGLSRILVGFHFRHAVEQGIRHGRALGNRVVERVLRPVERRD